MTEKQTEKQTAVSQQNGQSREEHLQMLKTMMVIRAFEEKAEALYALGQVHGTMHLSIGQEATAVGLSSALAPSDYLLNTHRGHGHCLAWGSTPDRMMAEFLGREAGYCRGRGGSMHIADVEANNLGANGIVAGGLPIAVGVGLSIKLRKTNQVGAVVFGDGASNEGAFHESLNMASIWQLPIIYLCENNQYAMSMAVERAVNIERISQRGCAYGIPGVTVDGNDVLAVQAAVAEAVERARAGDGPTLIEALTYRYRGHSKSDRQAYRTRDEVKEWQDRDPIRRFASQLGLNDELRETLLAEAQEIIEASVEFAKASPEPELSSIMEGVYA
ncbi:MAG: thiamine pyrophosphate-dependent dehydrogenase E1 component subunit alpha [Ardenticatenaceae bacterium]|nr:thiamine pyrophosphate-dependent dehydrogenase E1 component subunit alpha [Anaerolineales bacterium]MCB8940952.1 thiamine pyrophosphate-dependent dehydrogenase E1 component subunit alpha [Ardenticatenaceae bacterium]MCB8972291.1 thiamine pyrophosphate-dependent dehydrogenase E1 component subunit alpha [Ardenticatenaceae bacterium]